MSDESRTLPHSIEAERALLGAILLHPEVLATVAPMVGPGEFYRTGHEHLFRVMQELESDGTAIDLTTIAEALNKTGRLEAAGGRAYISALIDGVPRSTNVEHYAGIVRDKAQRRALIAASKRIADDAYEADDEVTDVVRRAEAALMAVGQGKRQGGFKRLSDILPSVIEQIEQWQKSPGAISGIPSGLAELDEILRGFQPSTLNIIAARPGMGKSSLIENIARTASADGRVVLIFSLEMADEEYALRALASEAAVDSQRLQRGFVGAMDLDKIGKAWERLAALPVFIDDNPYATVVDVRSGTMRLKAQEGRVDLVVVDYAQLMLSTTKTESRAIEVGNITRALKGLAKELKIPVIALAQLNRGLESRDDKRPRLSDLRDSGRIEEDADVVMFIYRDEVYNEQSSSPGVAELIVAKHRSGPLSLAKVRWVAKGTRFENLDPHHQPATDQRLPVGDRA